MEDLILVLKYLHGLLAINWFCGLWVHLIFPKGLTMQPIVKNMPIPPMRRAGARRKYPWDSLQPGDAFKFEAGVSMAGAASLASAKGAVLQMKLAVRMVGDEIWCWRVDGTGYEVPNGNYRQNVDVVLNYARSAPPATETVVVGRESEVDVI